MVDKPCAGHRTGFGIDQLAYLQRSEAGCFGKSHVAGTTSISDGCATAATAIFDDGDSGLWLWFYDICWFFHGHVIGSPACANSWTKCRCYLGFDDVAVDTGPDWGSDHLSDAVRATGICGKIRGSVAVAPFALWDGGIVFYGCIIGGVIGLLVYCRRRKIDPLVLADVIAPSLFVGEGFGRIGCFLYGCCFGAECNLPWSVQFPPDSITFERLVQRGTIPADALSTVPLHPTQIYSSVAAFLLAGLLAWFYRRRPFDGAVLAMAWIIYPVNRYVLEIYRDDEPGRLGLALTFSQLMSIGLLVTGVAAMWWFSKRNKLTRAANT